MSEAISYVVGNVPQPVDAAHPLPVTGASGGGPITGPLGTATSTAQSVSVYVTGQAGGGAAITSVDIGVQADTVASTDTGTFSLIALFKRLLQKFTTGIIVTNAGTFATQSVVTQPTASNLNAAIVGTGTAGAAASGVVTVQGIASGTAQNVAQATAANLNATVVGTGTFAAQVTDTNLGAQADAAATTDTGTFTLISLFKRLLQKFTTGIIVTNAGTFAVQAAQATAASLNATVVGTGTFAVQAAQATASALNMTAAQPTAANLNATVVGTGTFAVQASGFAGTVTQTRVTLSAGVSGALIAANATRKGLRWMNTGANPMTVAPGASAAVANIGMNYAGQAGGTGSQGGSEAFDGNAVPNTAFQAISTLGTTVTVWETT